jgi:hypothetical protein
MHQPLIAAVCEGPAVAAAVEPAMVSAVSSVAAKVRARRVNMDGLRSGGGRSAPAW